MFPLDLDATLESEGLLDLKDNNESKKKLKEIISEER